MVPGITLSGATTAGIWVAALGIIGLLIKQVVPWLRQSHDAEAKLRDTLIERVQKLEDKNERQELKHAAEQRMSNHKLRNMMACFDAMLLMLEMNPDKAPEIVAKIKAMRATQMAAEAQEFAVIQAMMLSQGTELDEEE